MLKKMILGWNAAPGAPINWNPATDGDCSALPIRCFPPKALTDPSVRLQYVESAWEPTPQELEWLNQGGQLVLRICGWQVPVALYCEPPRGDKATHPQTGGDKTQTGVSSAAELKAVKCTACAGTGTADYAAFAMERCQVCGGTGQLPAATSTIPLTSVKTTTPDEARPTSPWVPHGPVQYLPVEQWGDQERAAYIIADLSEHGVSGMDDDKWVVDFLLRLLWAEIDRTQKNISDPETTDLTAVRLYTEIVQPAGIFVGRCAEFPGLACFDPTRAGALSAIAGVVSVTMTEIADAS